MTTFALTAFKAYGIRCEGATRLHALQRATFVVTATAADVAYDISSDTTGSLGTFWTAVIADATYGSIGTQALAVIQSIQNQVKSLQSVRLGGALNYVQGTATAASTYTVAVTTHLPSIAFNAANGPTSMTLTLEWILKDGLEPVVSDLGAAF